ncbi:MAG TPA: type IX secretion system sortase PorU [Saprospiraceae bacterium]|nr:type IX secretion system sortase PorU [Saprospiraceae bacterium]
MISFHRTHRFVFFLIGLLAGSQFGFAQTLDHVQVTLQWDKSPILQHNGVSDFKVWHFDGAEYQSSNPTIPFYSTRIALPSHGQIDATLQVQKTSSFERMGVKGEITHSKPTLSIEYEQERDLFFARIYVFPVYGTNGSFEKLNEFAIRLRFTPTPVAAAFRDTPTKKSKLRNGNIYKFAVSNNGLHKLDRQFLTQLGVDVGNINPKNIHILGNGGDVLPELIAIKRIDDLAENAIFVAGENDGQFNDNDFILFNAQCAQPVALGTHNNYRIKNNPYTSKAYYFLKIDDQPGKRVQSQNSLPQSNHIVEDYFLCKKHEVDKVNLLDEDPTSEGGGNEWFGEVFKAEKTQQFNDAFHFENVVLDKPALMHVRFAGKSYDGTSFSMTADDQVLHTNINGTGQGQWKDVAVVREFYLPFTPKGDNPSISITFAANTIESKGWLDYIEINAYQKLVYNGSPFLFGTLSDTPQDLTTFSILTNSQDVKIWDVTNPQTPVNQSFAQAGDHIEFTTNTDSLKTFAVFKESDNFPTPEAIGQIDNQNIHGIEKADLIVIYPNVLKNEALKLAAHRASHSQLDVVTVNIEDIYNEFSSGAQDPTAIRDFAKMVFDRDPGFKYLLLMGDGSYDAKNINNNPQNYNLIPVRETQNSVRKINTYPSDDYYGLLSDTEGTPNLKGALDIAVGRITARTPEEANSIVEKIIYYDSNPATLKPWRTQLMGIGDDEDGNTHMRQANQTADRTEMNHKIFNTQKILLDAYPQVPAPFGARFPEATKQINDGVLSGTLVVNYFGHGGAKGLAQERVLTLQSITKWKNILNNMPLIITASCSTSGFDDPSVKTFGEELLKNPTGGAIALFSTVRPVYSSDNEALINATYPQIFVRDNGQKRTVGEILRVGKNNAGTADKVRKFLLLGDPSMPLALPDNNQIITDKINGTSLQTVDSVAIGALTKVTITGHIANEQGQLLSDFNGKVYITIFDKEANFKTLGQDGPPYPYKDRKGIIFKGIASVKTGQFQFNFIVPKDVVSHGYGKISYYASDEISRDAAGYSEKLYIGGGSGVVIVDDTPPVVELFMNDENFVSGGITNDHPTIFAKIADDNGINISGSGIGHDLTATIDEDIKVANNYYETKTDDYTQGELHYPLENISPGEHKIAVKAWDVANNSGEAAITFFVAENEDAALAHVLNYPNPFTTQTSFQFEHNLSGPTHARINIFSVDGKIIKTIDKDLSLEGYRVTDIQWDGTDEYGDALAKGVYIYQVKLTSTEDNQKSTTSDFQKLVIMK